MRHTKRSGRYGRIVLAYVLALGARLPENLDALLPAIFAAVPDTTLEEIRAAIRWGIAQSRRSGLRFERAMRGGEARRRRPRLRVVR